MRDHGQAKAWHFRCCEPHQAESHSYKSASQKELLGGRAKRFDREYIAKQVPATAARAFYEHYGENPVVVVIGKLEAGSLRNWQLKEYVNDIDCIRTAIEHGINEVGIAGKEINAMALPDLISGSLTSESKILLETTPIQDDLWEETFESQSSKRNLLKQKLLLKLYFQFGEKSKEGVKEGQELPVRQYAFRVNTMKRPSERKQELKNSSLWEIESTSIVLEKRLRAVVAADESSSSVVKKPQIDRSNIHRDMQRWRKSSSVDRRRSQKRQGNVHVQNLHVLLLYKRSSSGALLRIRAIDRILVNNAYYTHLRTEVREKRGASEHQISEKLDIWLRECNLRCVGQTPSVNDSYLILGEAGALSVDNSGRQHYVLRMDRFERAL
ncbi:unnamed protein product [Cylicocyclus nassatus]|uniref:Uncharacterized protein n=1 Tax=Cylicocyclus nassatus TaxID=53992 RepID=A0AA36HH35_CYLNA|nr:unnamed protein product [Cylicocyclus nassatus]